MGSRQTDSMVKYLCMYCTRVKTPQSFKLTRDLTVTAENGGMAREPIIKTCHFKFIEFPFTGSVFWTVSRAQWFAAFRFPCSTVGRRRAIRIILKKPKPILAQPTWTYRRRAFYSALNPHDPLHLVTAYWQFCTPCIWSLTNLLPIRLKSPFSYIYCTYCLFGVKPSFYAWVTD